MVDKRTQNLIWIWFPAFDQTRGTRLCFYGCKIGWVSARLDAG